MALERGKPAPTFSLEDMHGKSVSLKSLAGKHVILYFYPRDNTPGCTKEAEGFRDLWPKLQKHNAVVVGVSPDSAASHCTFADKFKLPFSLLVDADKKIMTAYGAWGEKMMYGRKVTGVIRSTVWIGPDGRVIKHWAKVPKAADHPAHVLAALEAGAEASDGGATSKPKAKAKATPVKAKAQAKAKPSSPSTSKNSSPKKAQKKS